MRRIFPLLLLGGCLWISAAEHGQRFDRTAYGTTTTTEPTCGSFEIACDGIDNDCIPNTKDGPFFVSTPQGDLAYASIAAAMDQHNDVNICPRTVWTESIVIEQPGSSIRCTGQPHNTAVTAADGTRPVIEVRAPNVTLEGFTVRGGTGIAVNSPTPIGGGIYAAEAGGTVFVHRMRVYDNDSGIASPSQGRLELVDSTIDENTEAGGLWVLDEATIQNSFIISNVGVNGGGVAVVAGATLSGLDGTVIRDNTATLGGGVYLFPGARLTGAVVDGNHASQGGGVAMDDATLDGTVVTANDAPDGGGIYVVGTAGSESILTSVLIEQNTSVGNGAGIYVASGTLRMGEGLVDGNIAQQSGGGLFVAVDGEVELLANAPAITHNTALYGAGGGLALAGHFSNASTLVISDNVADLGGGVALLGCADCPSLSQVNLVANHARRGGGAYSDQGKVSFSGGLIDNNTTEPGGSGSGIYARGGMALQSSEISNNSAEVLVLETAGQLTAVDCTFDANASPTLVLNGTDCDVPVNETTFSCEDTTCDNFCR